MQYSGRLVVRGRNAAVGSEKRSVKLQQRRRRRLWKINRLYKVKVRMCVEKILFLLLCHPDRCDEEEAVLGRNVQNKQHLSGERAV